VYRVYILKMSHYMWQHATKLLAQLAAEAGPRVGEVLDERHTGLLWQAAQQREPNRGAIWTQTQS
jgi:hypothetical protein